MRLVSDKILGGVRATEHVALAEEEVQKPKFHPVADH